MWDEYSEIEIENDAILNLLCRNLCWQIQFPPPVLQTTSAAPTPWVMVPQTPCVLPEVAPIKLLACSAFASHFVIRMSICDAPVIWIIRPYDLSIWCPRPNRFAHSASPSTTSTYLFDSSKEKEVWLCFPSCTIDHLPRGVFYDPDRRPHCPPYDVKTGFTAPTGYKNIIWNKSSLCITIFFCSWHFSYRTCSMISVELALVQLVMYLTLILVLTGMHSTPGLKAFERGHFWHIHK